MNIERFEGGGDNHSYTNLTYFFFRVFRLLQRIITIFEEHLERNCLVFGIGSYSFHTSFFLLHLGRPTCTVITVIIHPPLYILQR